MAGVKSLDDLPIFSRSNPPDQHFPYQTGAVFLIDKPKGWTSFDVVKYLRKAVSVKKVGHAGTLDPMATGLLIICCGKATKKVEEFQKMPKEYIAEITFGGTTPSHDAETAIAETAPYDHVTLEKVREVLEADFTGTIEQIPPMYSALKYGGKKLYNLAREGREVKRNARRVTIHESEILEFELPVARIRFTCSKGTYVRKLAIDLARKLETLAYLSGLVRSSIGDYSNSDAFTIDELSEIKF